MMSTDRSNRGSDHPVMSLSFALVAMITEADPRISSGPAATAPRSQAGHMTAPDPTLPIGFFFPCTAGAVHT